MWFAFCYEHFEKRLKTGFIASWITYISELNSLYFSVLVGQNDIWVRLSTSLVLNFNIVVLVTK